MKQVLADASEGEGVGEDMEDVETDNILPVLPHATLELALIVSAWALAAGDDVVSQ